MYLTVNNLIATFLGLRQKDEKGSIYNPMIMIIQNTVQQYQSCLTCDYLLVLRLFYLLISFLCSFPLTNHLHQELLVVIHSYLTVYIKNSEPYPMERWSNTFTLHTTHNLVLPSLCKGIRPLFCQGGGCLKFSNSASVAVANSNTDNSAWVRIHLLVSN